MSVQDKLLIVNTNKKDIDNIGKFDKSLLNKINYKFRLDWNYYSNKMEGGTLTREETRSVMIGNINVNGKPIKDVLEMKGHNQIISEILKMGINETRISERRIKDIHTGIMHEDNPEKLKEVGNWKSKANLLTNYKGEEIHFSAPSDVPEEIHKLLNETNAELNRINSRNQSLHPVILAANFHLSFVSIHPFYDGNGRTARILTNIILISCGYPPIIINENKKTTYYQLLADIQAYGGDTSYFNSFLIDRVIESQQLIIDAINGKDIEDKDDIDKEIELFKQEAKAKEIVGTTKKSNKLIAELYDSWIKYLIQGFSKKHEQFNELFTENNYSDMINNGYPANNPPEDYIFSELNNNAQYIKELREINSLSINITHKGYTRNGLDSFTITHWLVIKTDEYQIIIGDGLGNNLNVVYSSIPTPSELDSLINKMIKSFLEKLKGKIT